MAVFDDIQSAGKGEVMVYAPYYPKNKQKTLPKALGLYQIGSVEGKRVIEKRRKYPLCGQLVCL